MIAKATATIPATRPCVTSPSHSKMAGEAPIKATRMKRTFDTPKSDLDRSERTLHETRHSHKRAARPRRHQSLVRGPDDCQIQWNGLVLSVTALGWRYTADAQAGDLQWRSRSYQGC